MTDPGSLLAELVSQAFAGSDLARLVWTSALGSLLVTSKTRPWAVALLVFGIDRALPFWAMAGEHGGEATIAAIFAQLASLPGDLPAFALRYAGILGIVYALWRARLSLHGRRPVTKAEPGAA